MTELGILLVRAREARGLTLEDAERDTRISRRYLQALESEQFDAIPAPVYARGFLRSYSQYLGLDPQEMLARFPRDDEPAQPVERAAPNRPQRQQRQAAQTNTAPPRPTWRGPQQQQAAQGRQQPLGGERREAAQPQRERQQTEEPMIGVDIGVPAPARRLERDPAAQTRSLVIAVVAVAAVVGVLLLAFLISNLGGGSEAPGASANSTTTAGAGATTQAGGSPTSALPTSDIPTTPGVVPGLIGLNVEKARAAIAAAGLKVNETTQKSTEPKGNVINQAPAADSQVGALFTVQIVVSDGP
jgi:hypothetical protein